MAVFVYTVSMSWAARRRFIILTLLGIVVVTIFALTIISTVYKAPSCSDGIQNQGEQGIDCGGPCAYLCTALEQPPTVLFTKAIANGAGRTDVIAEVENKNADAAARSVPYTITLFGADKALVQTASGMVELPPGASVPVFFPRVASGNQVVTGAFLSIDSSAVAWYRLASDPRNIPLVSNTTLSGQTATPSVEAILTNNSTVPISQAKVIVMVRNTAGNVIAASQTVVPLIPGQGHSTANFTWNEPFSEAPASIEVVPIIPLP